MGAARGMHSYNSRLFVAVFGTPDPANVSALAQWGEIEDVISMNGVPMEHTVTQITHLKSPGKAMEKVPGFLDGGQQTIRLNYNKELVAQLQGYMPGAVGAPDTAPSWGRLQWAVVFPDSGVWVFRAFVKSQPHEIPEDNRNTVELVVEIDGRPVFYAFS
jgi:hypothetical protein